MSYEAIDCVDAGTEYCPCYLAETNNCIICSNLQGKVFCDCINWKGVCIYQEYVWNKNKEARDYLQSKIIEKKLLNDKILFLKLKVNRTLARELNQPGAYIFLRSSNYPALFDAPMSIMYSDEINEYIELLVQIKGIKTKTLINEFDSFIIKGPYFNGLLGLKNLKTIANKNCLIVTRGISQAPSVLVAKKLSFSHNNIEVLFDKGTSGVSIAKEYFYKYNCNIFDREILNKDKSFNENTKIFIKDYINSKDINFIFSGGSDIINKEIFNIIKQSKKGILYSCTNNANICCGEGICGSCCTRLANGNKVKLCKTQINPEDLFEEME